MITYSINITDDSIQVRKTNHYATVSATELIKSFDRTQYSMSITDSSIIITSNRTKGIMIMLPIQLTIYIDESDKMNNMLSF